MRLYATQRDSHTGTGVQPTDSNPGVSCGTTRSDSSTSRAATPPSPTRSPRTHAFKKENTSKTRVGTAAKKMRLSSPSRVHPYAKSESPPPTGAPHSAPSGPPSLPDSDDSSWCNIVESDLFPVEADVHGQGAPVFDASSRATTSLSVREARGAGGNGKKPVRASAAMQGSTACLDVRGKCSNTYNTCSHTCMYACRHVHVCARHNMRAHSSAAEQRSSAQMQAEGDSVAASYAKSKSKAADWRTNRDEVERGMFRHRQLLASIGLVRSFFAPCHVVLRASLDRCLVPHSCSYACLVPRQHRRAWLRQCCSTKRSLPAHLPWGSISTASRPSILSSPCSPYWPSTGPARAISPFSRLLRSPARPADEETP